MASWYLTCALLEVPVYVLLQQVNVWKPAPKCV